MLSWKILYWHSFTNLQLCWDDVSDSGEHLGSFKHVAFLSTIFHQDFFFLQALINSLSLYISHFHPGIISKQSVTFTSILIKNLLQNRINHLFSSSILPLTPPHANLDSWTGTINHPSFTLLTKQQKLPPKSLLKRVCFAEHPQEVNP